MNTIQDVYLSKGEDYIVSFAPESREWVVNYLRYSSQMQDVPFSSNVMACFVLLGWDDEEILGFLNSNGRGFRKLVSLAFNDETSLEDIKEAIE